MMSAILQQFAAVRAQLDAAAGFLVAPSPEVLDRAAATLESAAQQIADCNSQLTKVRGDADVFEAARQVRSAFFRVRKLIENAVRFHAGWLSIRGAMTGGYTERGEPAPLRHPGRICIEA